MKTIQIRLPATTANFGTGYDAIGASLSIYLNIKAQIAAVDDSRHQKLDIEYTNKDDVSLDPEENLILSTLKVALYFWDKLEILDKLEVKITVDNNIPMGKGLGSSAAAILSAVCLANELAEMKLSVEEMLQFSMRYESHPDNIYPCGLGGCVVAAVNDSDKKVAYSKLNLNPNIKPIILVPPEPLETETTRELIPQSQELANIVQK